MENQKTNLNNDETRIDPNNKNTQAQKAAVTNKTATNSPQDKKDSSKVKTVALGGLGVIAGAAGVAGLMAFRTAPSMEETVSNGTQSLSSSQGAQIQEPENLEEIKLAHSPNDDMSFNAAFASARQEVGAHGVFEWRGGVYGTYYANEWENLPEEYKTQFSNNDWRSEFGSNSQQTAYNQPVSQTQNAETTSTEEDKFGEHEIKTDENGQEYISLTDAVTGEEVRIAPEDLKYAITDGHGELVGIINEGTYDAISNESMDLTGYYEIDENGNLLNTVSNDTDIQEIIELIDNDDNNVVLLNAQYDDQNADETPLTASYIDGQETIFIDEELDGQYDISVIDDTDGLISPSDSQTLGDDTGYLADSNLPDYNNDASIDDFIV